MTFPLVEDLAAEGVPVTFTCGLLGFSPQAFYKWKKRPCSDRDWADAHAINAIVDVHADDPEFGYRLISDELEAGGQRSCERRVWRLCRQQRVWSTTTKKGRKQHGKTPGPAVHDDLVQRVFRAPAPDLVWLTDITEHPTAEGKLYCCSLKDCFSNRIVGYAIGDRMTADLTVAALRSAIARRQPHGTVIVHADRGGQFRSRKFRATLKANGLAGSMGRVASAADNAAMESFHSLLQKNVLNRQRTRPSRAELRYEIVVWIEHTYNRRRRQRALGRLTPVEFELAFTPPPPCLEDEEDAA
jgi:transposase InsO family protein